jgi:uncharacterized protein (TIGR02118 family)
MIRISILYPHAPGGRFDHDYYETVHIPLALELLGGAVRSVSVERGVEPGGPWPAPTYAAICHFVCESLEAYERALAPHMARLQADLANYSDRTAVIQVGEITIDRTVGPA